MYELQEDHMLQVSYFSHLFQLRYIKDVLLLLYIPRQEYETLISGTLTGI